MLGSALTEMLSLFIINAINEKCKQPQQIGKNLMLVLSIPNFMSIFVRKMGVLSTGVTEVHFATNANFKKKMWKMMSSLEVMFSVVQLSRSNLLLNIQWLLQKLVGIPNLTKF